MQFVWQQILTALQADIDEGRYGIGDKLPTEAALSIRFGVNRHTVRRALQELAQLEVISIRKGSGSTVMPKKIPYTVGKTSRFSSNLVGLHKSGRRRIVRAETIRADKTIAEQLALSRQDPVHLLEYIASVEGAPILYSVCYYPAKLLPNFLQAFQQTLSVTASLMDDGISSYQRCWSKVRADRPPPAVARHLGMLPQSPALRIVFLNAQVETNLPVEYSTAWFVGDKIEINFDHLNNG